MRRWFGGMGFPRFQGLGCRELGCIGGVLGFGVRAGAWRKIPDSLP